MTRYLLDTNIISNAIKPVPSPSLLAWMAGQADEDLFIASLTLAEIRRGLLELPSGRKRRDLEAWFAGPEGPQALFSGRVLAFDEPAAMVWARLMSEGRKSGRPRNALDMIVAAIAEANACVVVTDNERHFAGLEFVNPLRGGKMRSGCPARAGHLAGPNLRRRKTAPVTATDGRPIIQTQANSTPRRQRRTMLILKSSRRA